MKYGRRVPLKLPLKRGPRMTFNAPSHEQFKRAAHLEAAFRAYAISLGCTFGPGGDEITATGAQAAALHIWFLEQRL